MISDSSYCICVVGTVTLSLTKFVYASPVGSNEK